MFFSKDKRLIKKYASTVMVNPSYVDKCVSALLQCVSMGAYNDLPALQNIVVGLGKKKLANSEMNALFLSTNEQAYAGNHRLMLLLSDIAKERLNAPSMCPCFNGSVCSHGNQRCSLPAPECYPLCYFMKGSFFTEFMRGHWEWKQAYVKTNI